MIRVLIYNNRSALDIIDEIRSRFTGEESDKVVRYRKWIMENNIQARIVNMYEIEFEHEEEVILFKLRFGV